MGVEPIHFKLYTHLFPPHFLLNREVGMVEWATLFQAPLLLWLPF